jgi:hypothetical protein
MDRLSSSDEVCATCEGKRVVFLWVRDSKADGRWVINEAIHQHECNRHIKVCRCQDQ